VRFRPAPQGRGTEVLLRLDAPAGGTLGFVPSAVAGKALRNFKSLVETGEIPTLKRNPSGRGRGDTV
jgi:hypothetical protein